MNNEYVVIYEVLGVTVQKEYAPRWDAPRIIVHAPSIASAREVAERELTGLARDVGGVAQILDIFPQTIRTWVEK